MTPVPSATVRCEHGDVSEETEATALRHPQVRVTTSSGSIAIVAEDRDDVEVTSRGKVRHRPASDLDDIDVRRSDSVELRCPVGADVVAGTEWLHS